VKCYQMIWLLGLTLCRVVSRRRFGGRWCSYLRSNFKLQLDRGQHVPPNVNVNLQTHKVSKAPNTIIRSMSIAKAWQPNVKLMWQLLKSACTLHALSATITPALDVQETRFSESPVVKITRHSYLCNPRSDARSSNAFQREWLTTKRETFLL
jgi:hypothetical protein